MHELQWIIQTAVTLCCVLGEMNNWVIFSLHKVKYINIWKLCSWVVMVTSSEDILFLFCFPHFVLYMQDRKSVVKYVFLIPWVSDYIISVLTTTDTNTYDCLMINVIFHLYLIILIYNIMMLPDLRVLGVWEEIRAPRVNLRRHVENMHNAHRERKTAVGNQQLVSVRLQSFHVTSYFN